MGKRRKFATWSPEAVADVNDIWNYYAEIAGSNTAANVLHDIDETIALIKRFPSAGRARGEIRKDLRSFTIGAHVLFYTIAKGIPEVVRILDGRRDIDQILAEES